MAEVRPSTTVSGGAVFDFTNQPKPLRPMLVSGEVAVALNFLHNDGTPDRRKVRKLAREGRIPGPVDPDLHALDHRWARRDIEAYCDGTWTPAKTTPIRGRRTA